MIKHINDNFNIDNVDNIHYMGLVRVIREYVGGFSGVYRGYQDARRDGLTPDSSNYIWRTVELAKTNPVITLSIIGVLAAGALTAYHHFKRRR